MPADDYMAKMQKLMAAQAKTTANTAYGSSSWGSGDNSAPTYVPYVAPNTGGGLPAIPMPNSADQYNFNYGTTTWPTQTSPAPPPKEEQEFDDIKASQVISLVIALLENPETKKMLETLIGVWEIPDKDNIINVINMMRKDILLRNPVSYTHDLNAVQSLVNLLGAVSKELGNLVKLGRAQIVEKITE